MTDIFIMRTDMGDSEIKSRMTAVAGPSEVIGTTEQLKNQYNSGLGGNHYGVVIEGIKNADDSYGGMLELSFDGGIPAIGTVTFEFGMGNIFSVWPVDVRGLNAAGETVTKSMPEAAFEKSSLYKLNLGDVNADSTGAADTVTSITSFSLIIAGRGDAFSGGTPEENRLQVTNIFFGDAYVFHSNTDTSAPWIGDQIKSYDEFKEICITGLALPASTTDFMVEMRPEYPVTHALPKFYRSETYVYDVDYSTGKTEATSIVYVETVERISKTMYQFNCQNYIGIMDSPFDGDLYDDIGKEGFLKTYKQIVEEIAQGEKASFTFQTPPEGAERMEDRIAGGRIKQCPKREALQNVLFALGAVMIEKKPLQFVICSGDAFTLTGKRIPQSDIFINTNVSEDRYTGIEMTVVDYLDPTTYVRSGFADSGKRIRLSNPSRPYTTLTDGKIDAVDAEAAGLTDHIIYYPDRQSISGGKPIIGPEYIKTFTDDLYYRKLWFYNMTSNPLMVKGIDGDESVENEGTSHIARKSSNYIEISCEGGLNCNVYGFKLNRAEGTKSKHRGKEPFEPEHVLKVSGSEMLNSSNYETEFNMLYDHYVNTGVTKHKIQFRPRGLCVGDVAMFAGEYGESVYGIITDMSYTTLNRNVAEATVTSVCRSGIKVENPPTVLSVDLEMWQQYFVEKQNGNRTEWECTSVNDVPEVLGGGSYREIYLSNDIFNIYSDSPAERRINITVSRPDSSVRWDAIIYSKYRAVIYIRTGVYLFVVTIFEGYTQISAANGRYYSVMLCTS